MKSKDPRLIRKRDFQCLICGMVSPATKFARKTVPGHIKHMYCAACDGITEHIQTDNAEWEECEMKVRVMLRCQDLEELAAKLASLEALARRFPKLRFEAEVEVSIDDGWSVSRTRAPIFYAGGERV